MRLGYSNAREIGAGPEPERQNKTEIVRRSRLHTRRSSLPASKMLAWLPAPLVGSRMHLSAPARSNRGCLADEPRCSWHPKKAILRTCDQRLLRPVCMCQSASADSATAHAGPDPDVVRCSDGTTFYNKRLDAANVWEVDVDPEVIEEVAQIFFGEAGDSSGGPFAGTTGMAEPYQEIETTCGTFFAQRVSWDSNIAWVSVDDQRSLSRFEALFSQLSLAERFASVIPHDVSPRLYSAFFVTRSFCNSHNFHTDYFANVGTHAMTLITPLRDYTETDSFQLTYCRQDEEGQIRLQPDGRTPELRRYVYQKGKAVVFGSRFEHSTEPGASREPNDGPHAYLCFTFGTDIQARWPDISQTLGTQSRIVVEPDGELRLSAVGQAIEEALAAMES